jgi:iron complex transport system substrate-binding protein
MQIFRVPTVLMFALLAACRNAPTPATTTERLVIAGAGLAEAVAALGAADRVIAVDRTARTLAPFAGLPDVGMPQQLSADGILALAPTAVLLGDEAGPDGVLTQLGDAGIAVERWTTTYTPEDAIARIERLGERLGKVDAARTLAASLRARLADLAPAGARPRALFLYARGHRVLLAAGASTAAHAMLERAGFDNIFKDIDGMKPIDAEAVVARDPAVIIMPTKSLESLGGLDGVLALPGVAKTRAAAAGRVITAPDLALLGFGPGMIDALEVLVSARAGLPIQ